jgi:hypothetical protein
VHLAVGATGRGRGIGRAALSMIAQLASEAGVHTLTAQTPQSDDATTRFLTRQGFTCSGQVWHARECWLQWRLQRAAGALESVPAISDPETRARTRLAPVQRGALGFQAQSAAGKTPRRASNG